MSAESGTPFKKSNHFGVLFSLGNLINVVGWIVVAVSVLIGLFSFSKNSAFAVYVCLAGAVIGILIVAQGQLLTCFVTIGRNTEDLDNNLNVMAEDFEVLCADVHAIREKMSENGAVSESQN